MRLIDLGDAETIENGVRAARQALVKSPELIRSDGEPEAEQQLLEPLGNVAKAVLNPILAQSGEADTLILSPDASLWLVPWSALPLADSRIAVAEAGEAA